MRRGLEAAAGAEHTGIPSPLGCSCAIELLEKRQKVLPRRPEQRPGIGDAHLSVFIEVADHLLSAGGRDAGINIDARTQGDDQLAVHQCIKYILTLRLGGAASLRQFRKRGRRQT